MIVERRHFVPAYERALALAEGQHAGILSTMSADERTEAIRNHAGSEELAPALNKSLVVAALTQSVHGKPVRSLGQLLNKIPLAELRTGLKGFGLQGLLISAMKKKDIVALLSQTLSMADVGYMDYICSMGTSFLTGVKRIVEAGGSIEVPFGDVVSTDQLVMPRFPITYLTVAGPLRDGPRRPTPQRCRSLT